MATDNIAQIERHPKFSQRRAVEARENEKKERIKIWMGVCLVLVAFSIDTLEMIFDFIFIGAIINPVMAFGAAFLFWLWFQILGVPYTTSPKRLATQCITFIVETIPFLDAIPFLSFLWTIGMILTVYLTWAEDKGGIIGKATNIAQGKFNKAA
jgi:hypothetical protein